MYPKLQSCIEHLIIAQNVDRFYVGHQGRFDALALKALRELKGQYPVIAYYVVLAYLPQKQLPYDVEGTIYPEGLETVPPCFAIEHRNRWMVDHSDFVVAALHRDFGGAAEAVRYARNRGKVVMTARAENPAFSVNIKPATIKRWHNELIILVYPGSDAAF